MWDVQVWFATSDAFRRVGRFALEEDAMREARGYLSDSRGVCVVHSTTGVTHWLKRPTGAW